MTNTKIIEKESDIVKAILDWLHYNHFKCWRNNSGAHFVSSKGKDYAIRMAPAGTPDIIGLSKQGKFIGIEVKRKRGIVSVEQAEFLLYLNNSGGVGLVAYSLDDVIHEFKVRGLI